MNLTTLVAASTKITNVGDSNPRIQSPVTYPLDKSDHSFPEAVTGLSRYRHIACVTSVKVEAHTLRVHLPYGSLR
ncbi:hypothetical protein TNCV_1930981 [Trichonephila clavipes]|nr:hypothetical protein TNCV_1930981 [Trichonephila clavipes]